MAKNTCLIFCNGRICKEPKVYTTTNGGTFCAFPLAVDNSVLENGTWNTVAMFFDVTTYQKGIFDYLEKGRLITVCGTLSFSKWTDAMGVERENHVIRAENIELLPRGQKQESEIVASQPVANQQSYATPYQGYKQTVVQQSKTQAKPIQQVNRIQQMRAQQTTAKIGPDAFNEDNMDF